MKPIHTWKYITTDGEERYLLAPDLETAVYSAAELSGGTNNLKNIWRHNDEEWE